MSRWKKQLNEHPIWNTIKEIREHLDVEPDDAGEDYFTEKRRMLEVIGKIESALNRADPELMPFILLGQIDQQLSEHVRTRTEAFSSDHSISNLKEANDCITDQVLRNIGSLQASCGNIGRERREQIDRLKARVDEFVNSISSKQKSTKQEIDDLGELLQERQSNLMELGEIIDAKKGETDELIAAWQDQFNQDQQSRQSAFDDGLIAACQEKFDENQQSQQETFDSAFKDFTKEAKQRIEELDESTKNELMQIIREAKEKHEKILEIYEIVATDSAAAGYMKDAKDEKRSADWLRRLSFAFIIATIYWLYHAIFNIRLVEDHLVDWSLSIMLISLTGVLLYGAGYAARQSTHHRNNERKDRWLALHVAAFEPFISSLPDEQKDALRKDFVAMIFNDREEEVNRVGKDK